MKQLVPIPDCGKGINKDALPSELELGMWSGDTLNWRFGDGFAEKWDGAQELINTTSSPLWHISYSPDSSSRYYVYINSNGDVIARNGLAGNTTITPERIAESITSVTRIGANTAEVTTASAHGLATGNTIAKFDTIEAAYDMASAAITVISPTVFQYTTTSPIIANATVVGQYSVLASAAATLLTGTNCSEVTGFTLNGVLWINHARFGLFYWNGNTALDLRQPPFSTYLSVAARGFNERVVQFGPTIGGVKFRSRVVWSDAAEAGAIPTTTTASATNDAGFQDIGEDDGAIVDAAVYGSDLIVYTQISRWAMHYLPGDTLVFSFQRLPGNDGLLKANCIAITPAFHVFVTSTLDVRMHQGGVSESIIEEINLRYLQANVNVNSSTYYHVSVDPRKNDVYICVPFTNSGGARTGVFMVWNWKSKKWSQLQTGVTCFYATSGLAYVDSPVGISGQVKDVLIVASGTQLGVVGGSALVVPDGKWFTTTLTSTLERTGLHLGDYQAFRNLDGLMINADATAGATSTVQLGSSKTADGTVTYTAGATHTVGTTVYADQRATSGPFGAIKIATTAYPYRVRSMQLRFSKGGQR